MSVLQQQFAKTSIPKADVYTFTWTLADYYKRFANYYEVEYKEAGEFVQSPNFVLYNQSCFIRWYPKGTSIQGGKLDHVSAHIHFEKTKERISEQLNAPIPVKANASLSILTKSGKKYAERSIRLSFSNALYDWYISNFIELHRIFDESSDFLTDGCMKLYFELKIYFKETHVSCNSIISSSAETKEFSNYMEKLFLKTEFSDIKFKFATEDGKELPAHKNILAIRLPFFEKMFQSNMKENITNIVEITDIEFNVFKEVLRFIYTGKVGDINDTASSLIMAADKYGIDFLKFKCAEHLSKAMTVENVINILEVSDRYNVDNLKNQALHFIKANLATIISSNAFETMAVGTKPSLLCDILRSFK